jgi:hypothetical protein
MARTAPFHRLRRLSLAEAAALAEALPVLAAASLAIRLLPFRRLAAAASAWGRGSAPPDPAAVERVRRAVNAWARRVPWKTVCFQKGLALHFMLRRRGIASVLRYGVGKSESHALAAHVWIDVGAETVMGGEEAPKFTCLARFPPEPA